MSGQKSARPGNGNRRAGEVRGQKSEVRSQKKRISSSVLCLLSSVFCLLNLSGCAPSFPKGHVEEAIVKICKKEYKIDVKAKTAGKTVAIYLPLPNLLDFNLAITKEAGDRINDVVLTVSRVTLSTDAKYDFYCIIAHDVRVPEVQIIVIKSVDDIKRFLLNDVSRGEYSKRMLVDMRLSPQAQKEGAVKEVFDKMKLDTEWQDQVMDDFFRSEPTAIGDIGYWNDRFYIKDITMPEFLAEQIAGRIRIDVREDKKFSEKIMLKSAKGVYVNKQGKKYFRIDVAASPDWLKGLGPADVSSLIFELATGVAIQVIHGYRFDDYDYVEIFSESDQKTVQILKEDLERIRTKKMKFEDVVK
jgi:hypothetical protein